MERDAGQEKCRRDTEEWIALKLDDCKCRVSKRCGRAAERPRKIFQILRKICVFEHQKAQFNTFSPLLGIFFNVFLVFCASLFAQKISRNILAAQENSLLESLAVMLREAFQKKIYIYITFSKLGLTPRPPP